jgi:tetratricopeptide (TPR) repeat protein
MAIGQWDVAIDSCMAVIGGDPGYLPVHIMLGDIYLSNGRVPEAMDKYQVVMDTYVARDDHESASDVCRRMLDVQPDNPTIQTRMGILLMAAGKVDEAARSLLSVAERHYHRGEPERALEEAEALKATMSNSADVALAVGTYRLALGQHLEAMGELSRALHLDPGNDTALARLYVTLAQTNDVAQWDALQSLLERAERDKGNDRLFMEELHNAVKQKPVPGVYYGLAVLAGRDNMTDIAADALDQGILLMSVVETSEIDKTWLLLEVLMRQFRGDLALNAKDGAVAAQQYGRVLDILKTHGGLGTEAQTTGELQIQSPRPQYGFTRIAEPIQLYYGLAEAYASQNDWDGAMQALQALKQLMPNDYSVYTRLADIYFRQGQLNQALSELNELLVLFQKAGDNEKTLETLGHMAKLAPNNVAVRRKLSDMYLKLGMTEYGLGELGTLAELQLKAGLLKDAMSTYQKAADLHYTLGQHDKAIQIYERIVRIAPRDIDARQQLLNMYVQSGKLKEAVEGERSLADLFIQEGRAEEAIAALHQLLALAPEDVPGHHLLARQLTSLGEYGQAARLYGRLLRLEPDNDRIPVLQNEMLRMAKEKGQAEHVAKAEKAAAGTAKKKGSNRA